MTIEADPQQTESVLEELAVAPSNSGVALTLTRNALLGVSRLFITSLVALVLPAYLTHKLPVKTYSAWILILQMSAYVSYLDFGVQTGVAKFVAEFEARADQRAVNLRASAGLVMMLFASLVGIVMTFVLAWEVPRLFVEMPSSFYPDVRISLVLVGLSLSIGLFFSVFSAIFVGLQRYDVPVAIAILSRFLFTIVVCATVYFHCSLAVMGAAVAVVNLITALAQFVAWRRLASRIRVRLTGVPRGVLKEMIGYCSVLAIWSAGMLCVSGLDITLVGRYDFSQTAFYSIATLPTNFVLAILAAALGPLMPTASALSTHRSPIEMGRLLSRTTRYSTIVLLLSGLPLLVGSYPILRLWAGPTYAMHSMYYLRILMLASILRNLCAPYATMLVAIESQRIAIAGAIAEAVVNVAASLYLVRHIGAVGVAFGTLLGSVVSVGVHFLYNMRRTYVRLSVSQVQLFANGLLRPGMIALPSIVLLPLWWSSAAPRLDVLVWLLWGSATLLLAWFAALDSSERRGIIGFARGRLKIA